MQTLNGTTVVGWGLHAALMAAGVNLDLTADVRGPGLKYRGLGAVLVDGGVLFSRGAARTLVPLVNFKSLTLGEALAAVEALPT